MGAMPAEDPSGELDQYVITLASAGVRIPLKVPFVHELIGFTVFRSRTVEDGRERFRLHLGYFASRARAQEALVVVRRYYAAARIVTAPRSGLGSLDDTMNTEFQMIRGATARVVRREEFLLPPLSPAKTTGAAIAPSIDAPRASEPQRYVVQLGWSMQPGIATPMPRLSVFRAYHLYSVRTIRGGTPYQGIRLGFFKNVNGARQVAEHIRGHYPRVGVVPVSQREYARVLEVLQQRTRHALAVVKRQRDQPANRNPSPEPMRGGQAVTGAPPTPPRAPLPAVSPSRSHARDKGLILPDLGDLKLGRSHDNPESEAAADELQMVHRFLELLAPREPKARI